MVNLSVGLKLVSVFDKYERYGAYHWNWATRNNHWYNKMTNLNISNMNRGESVLDIGCGDGYVCSLLKEKGLDVEGIDNNEVAIKLAKELVPNVKITIENIETLNLDRSFDYFLVQNVIEHIKDVTSLVNLFEKYCNKAMILATDIPEKRLGRYEYASYTFNDLKKIFEKYKIEKLYEFRKVYAVRISK